MTSQPTVVVHRDAAILADAVAARLITRLVDEQSARGSASIVLTGGDTGIAVLRAVAESPAQAAVDWSALDMWWGDERFLPAGDPDRNETQARDALLDRVPVDPARVFAMPPANEVAEPEEGADRYAAVLSDYVQAAERTNTPPFDVLLLGMGPDGHVASLFPEHPALDDHRPVVAVRNSPKPPPLRTSLSMSTIRSADEVWLVVAGEDKAPVVRMALTGASPTQIPAAGVYGKQATRWLIDQAAASELPPDLAGVTAPSGPESDEFRR